MLRTIGNSAKHSISLVMVPRRHMTLSLRPPPITTDCADVIKELKKFKHTGPLPLHPYKTGLEYINEIPIIEVDGNTAICDGDDEAGLGHPRQFLQLNRSTPNSPETCKYCSLRYVKKVHHH